MSLYRYLGPATVIQQTALLARSSAGSSVWYAACREGMESA